MEQKQKQGDPAEAPRKQSDALTENKELLNAAERGKDLLKRLDQAAKPQKRGRWVNCCGVRVFVED